MHQNRDAGLPGLVPVGMEGGKNVNTGANDTSGSMVAAVQSPNFVARAKAGGQLTLFYQNRETPFPFKRVDLDLGMVQRYLFFREAQMSSTSNPTLTLNKGYRPWYQASFKLYLVDSPSGRYGFRLSYNNGSLPPAFSETKSFQFGFLYESSDGETQKTGRPSGQ